MAAKMTVKERQSYLSVALRLSGLDFSDKIIDLIDQQYCLIQSKKGNATIHDWAIIKAQNEKDYPTKLYTEIVEDVVNNVIEKLKSCKHGHHSVTCAKARRNSGKNEVHDCKSGRTRGR